jgi:hypothetical protein
MDNETRTFLENFRRDVMLRLGAVERESRQLKRMFDDESPTRATVKFARDQAGTAFVGVLELRKLWQKDQAKKSNVTRIVVATIAAIALIVVGISQLISNVSAAKIELRAGDIVRRENVACEARIDAREEHLAKRVADETVRARDLQIDRITKGK